MRSSEFEGSLDFLCLQIRHGCDVGGASARELQIEGPVNDCGDKIETLKTEMHLTMADWIPGCWRWTIEPTYFGLCLLFRFERLASRPLI
jgi:hypothetical protein